MNKIIQFHLKIKACDPAWRWMIANQHLSPKELWDGCRRGDWLVDYLNKIGVSKSLIIKATCEHFMHIMDDVFIPDHLPEELEAIAENALDTQNADFKLLSTRPPTFENMLNALYIVSPDMPSRIVYKNGRRNIRALNQLFADAIRIHVPYDLVVAEREKMGG